MADALAAQGIKSLWTHQAECWAAAQRGEDFMVTTGTASGKSLCFNLPVLDGLLRDPHARAIYLYPTKALAQDQLRRIRLLAGRQVETAAYDGDTPTAARQLARQKARVLLTNPDMIHVSLLPRHERWADFFHNLRYVVIDEAHTYRGVFGSNVANVLRRLRRVASFYGAEPRFILASATIRNAREHAANLTGVEVTHISGDGAPVGARKIVFWEPPLVEDELNVRRSTTTEAADLLAELVRNQVRSICFTKSRRTAELIYQLDRRPAARRPTARWPTAYPPTGPATPRSSAAASRPSCSAASCWLWSAPARWSWASTSGPSTPPSRSAIPAPWPACGSSGAGPAGARARAWASSSPATTLWSSSSSAIRTCSCNREVEAATVDFANPFIHLDHLAAAAYEGASRRRRRPVLRTAGLRCRRWSKRPKRRAWCGARTTPGSSPARVSRPPRSVCAPPPASSTPSSTARPATSSAPRARRRLSRRCIPGAVYLHMGDTYLVTELDLDRRVALVRPFWDSYHTLPRRETDTRILSESLQTSHGPLTLHLGQIAVTSRVVAFQKRRTGSNEVLGTEELDLPAQEFVTEAMWFTIPPELFPTEADLVRLPGAIHAVEHALIALLPLFAMCDRWDIGGLSTPVHSQTEEPTIFVYDGHAGGVGISRQGFERFAEWVRDAHRLVRDCACEAGLSRRASSRPSAATGTNRSTRSRR